MISRIQITMDESKRTPEFLECHEQMDNNTTTEIYDPAIANQPNIYSGPTTTRTGNPGIDQSELDRIIESALTEHDGIKPLKR